MTEAKEAALHLCQKHASKVAARKMVREAIGSDHCIAMIEAGAVLLRLGELQQDDRLLEGLPLPPSAQTKLVSAAKKNIFDDLQPEVPPGHQVAESKILWPPKDSRRRRGRSRR